ncbi:MAG: glycosyltransferase [Bryobacterales bacterium]|nr:glycosyltransferase [Bryobacterales bacterium]
MTLHLVLDYARASSPAARSLLRLAAHCLERKIACRLYADESAALHPVTMPLSELAFVDDPEDILVWLYSRESPDIHLAERFPGIRALLCEPAVFAGAGGEQLPSLTDSFEHVWGMDAFAAEGLRRMGFTHAEGWPLPGEDASPDVLAQMLAGFGRAARRPRTGESATVSVVICTLNRAAHLESCLRQLRLQRYPRFEVIVVNGPSTDDTDAVLARFPGEIKARRNPLANLCISRNLGIAAAEGEIVAFLDDDSFAHPDWMLEALPAFDDPLTTAVGGLSYRFRDETVEFSNGLLTETAYPWPIRPKPGSHHRGADGLWNTVTGNNCFFRRDALLAVGGFDEQIPYTHDESNVVMKMARQGMRARHRPLAIVHHGSQPSLNRRDEFDLNWKVMVRDSIYCGFRNRPAASSALPFLSRTFLEHARHRLRDPIDWWLYRRVSFVGFLRIEKQCMHGLLAGAAKAILAAPRPISPELLAQPREPFLPFPRAEAPSPGSVALFMEGAPLGEALAREGFRANVLREGPAALLDSRRGVFFHTVPCAENANRPIGFWRKMQELAVRSGASLLIVSAESEDALLIGADPRFKVAKLESTDTVEFSKIAEHIRDAATAPQARCPLIECVPAERMSPSRGAIRWRDPVYERCFWNLPADGGQSLKATIGSARETGEYRLDLFAGLDEPPRESDAVCELALNTAEGVPLIATAFGGSHFGGTRWAILSASVRLEQSDAPLCLTLTNVGFSGLRVQRVELRRWNGAAAGS